MSSWACVDWRADHRELFRHVVWGSVGGLLYRLCEERWWLRGKLQHHWHDLLLPVHMWIHIPLNRVCLQPGWDQPTGSNSQLYYKFVFHTHKFTFICLKEAILHKNIWYEIWYASLSVLSPLLSRWFVSVSDFHRDSRDLVVFSSRSWVIRDDRCRRKRMDPLQWHGSCVCALWSHLWQPV